MLALPLDGFVPSGVAVHGLAHAAVVLHAALRGGGAVAREAVGEDLIHHAALEELGCLIVLVVDCQLEHFSLIQCAVAGHRPA